jgi:hypothetical protein
VTSASREWNALLVTQRDGGSVSVLGRGVGRWPTTEAVMADLLDAYREQRRATAILNPHQASAKPESVGPLSANGALGSESTGVHPTSV